MTVLSVLITSVIGTTAVLLHKDSSFTKIVVPVVLLHKVISHTSLCVKYLCEVKLQYSLQLEACNFSLTHVSSNSESTIPRVQTAALL